jgi:hypothetical protein
MFELKMSRASIEQSCASHLPSGGSTEFRARTRVEDGRYFFPCLRIKCAAVCVGGELQCLRKCVCVCVCVCGGES